MTIKLMVDSHGHWGIHPAVVLYIKVPISDDYSYNFIGRLVRERSPEPEWVGDHFAIEAGRELATRLKGICR